MNMNILIFLEMSLGENDDNHSTFPGVLNHK